MAALGHQRRIVAVDDESASPSMAPDWRGATKMAAGRDTTSRRDCASKYTVDLGGHDEVILMQSLDLLGL